SLLTERRKRHKKPKDAELSETGWSNCKPGRFKGGLNLAHPQSPRVNPMNKYDQMTTRFIVAVVVRMPFFLIKNYVTAGQRPCLEWHCLPERSSYVALFARRCIRIRRRSDPRFVLIGHSKPPPKTRSWRKCPRSLGAQLRPGGLDGRPVR